MPAAEHWLHRAFVRENDVSRVHCRHNVVQRIHTIEGLADDMMGTLTGNSELQRRGRGGGGLMYYGRICWVNPILLM